MQGADEGMRLPSQSGTVPPVLAMALPQVIEIRPHFSTDGDRRDVVMPIELIGKLNQLRNTLFQVGLRTEHGFNVRAPVRF